MGKDRPCKMGGQATALTKGMLSRTFQNPDDLAEHLSFYCVPAAYGGPGCWMPVPSLIVTWPGSFLPWACYLLTCVQRGQDTGSVKDYK